MQDKTVTVETVLVTLPPLEVRRHLFACLDFQTLLEARSVSKLWKSLVDPLLEFHLVLSDENKQTAQNFGSERVVTSLSTTKFQGRYPDGLNQLNVKMLRVSVKILEEPQTFINFRAQRQRKKGIFDGFKIKAAGISEYNFRRIVYDFSYVQKFQIASLAIKNFTNSNKLLAKIHLPNVSELIITFFDEGLDKLQPFLMNYFPKLRQLNVANIADTRLDRSNVYSWIFGFIARHYSTLEEVALIFPEGMAQDRQTDLREQILRDHKMPQMYYELANSKLQKLQLKKLTWDISNKEGEVGRFNMGSTLLMAQTKLCSLHLDNLRRKDLRIWRKLGTILESCSGTLQSLILGGCFCESFEGMDGEDPAFNIFNCSWLKDSKNLKALDVTVCGVVINNVEALPMDSLRSLNLGHRLLLRQIETIAMQMKNLEHWTILQKASMVDPLIPKIDLYLFETILFMPELKSISLFSDCIEVEAIMDFVRTDPGIEECNRLHLLDTGRSGDLTFHIDREKFVRDYSKLPNRINSHRAAPPPYEEEFLNRLIRNIEIGGRLLDYNGIVLVL